MNDLRPTFERESGLVVLEGLPAGAAGEAPLVPVPNLDLAFDRADGRLCRALITTCESGGSNLLGEQVAVMLARLFGAEAPGVVADAARSSSETSQEARVLSPRPGLAGTLSSLARLDAARATSPIPRCSPWWAAEAAVLAERAGLAGRASAEARQALAERSGRRGPQLVTPLPVTILNVAAEVESLENDPPQLASLHWMLDPHWVPEGLFQAGLSPHSDLIVRYENARSRVTVEALLVPGAECGALAGYQARLVDPSTRRILAQAGFTVAQSRARAELQLEPALDEQSESWVEVGPNTPWPVRSAKVHRIRRALRWADAALRAERAPAALAPASGLGDWTALAAAAWERCSHDWATVGDAARAYLATRRQAAIDPKTCVPPPPSAAAAEIARQVPVGGPAYLAEVLGR